MSILSFLSQDVKPTRSSSTLKQQQQTIPSKSTADVYAPPGPSASSVRVENAEFFKTFGQLLCRKIAFVEALDVSPLLPKERARICWDGFNVSIVTQGNIIKTFAFGDDTYSNVYIHSEDLIRLPYPSFPNAVRNLILALADYAILYTIPISFQIPKHILERYTFFVDAYRKIAIDTSKNYTFKDCVEYITHGSQFSYDSDGTFSYVDTKLNFHANLNTPSKKLHWLHAMVCGATFEPYDSDTTPIRFDELVKKCLSAALSKLNTISRIKYHKNNENTNLNNISVLNVGWIPWQTDFVPVGIKRSFDSTRHVSDPQENKIDLYLDLDLPATASPELKRLMMSSSSSSTQSTDTPFLQHTTTSTPKYVPQGIYDVVNSRCVITHSLSTTSNAPVRLIVNDYYMTVTATSLTELDKEKYKRDTTYLDALCPLEGDLFWSAPRTGDTVYTTLSHLTRMPAWTGEQLITHHHPTQSLLHL